MTAIAALAMYDWPEVAAANDALWEFLAARLRQAGIAAPTRLDRTLRHDQPWRLRHLLLAQTCGYPFVTQLRDKVQLVATPCYSAPGCAGADYCSVIVASRRSGIGSLAEIGATTAAVNSEQSQSGYWALRAALAATPGAQPPARAVLSGGHRQSLRMLAQAVAEVAAIDAVCWALAQRHEPDAVARVRIIARSPAAPGLPLITALTTPEPVMMALREAFQAVATEPSLAGPRAALLLAGFEPLPDGAYDRILELKRLALTLPFPALSPSPPTHSPSRNG